MKRSEVTAALWTLQADFNAIFDRIAREGIEDDVSPPPEDGSPPPAPGSDTEVVEAE